MTLRSRRTKPRRSSRVVDRDYLVRVASLSCAAIGLVDHFCSGDVIAHHAGTHGMGQKCSDLDTVPLCDGAHGDLHDRVGVSGTFASFNRHSLRAWENEQIARTQRLLNSSGSPSQVGTTSLTP